MTTRSSIKALSWEELKERALSEPDRVEGPTNAHANLRLFGSSEDTVRVTLYRDHHAWCPYCQKIWLWLEWKQIPYRISKVTMRCYGKKENWFLKKVPSGMLPALELDGRLITESDQILLELENTFGPLGISLVEPKSLELRHLERQLFRAWCQWLCVPNQSSRYQQKGREQFQRMAKTMEQKLDDSPGPWLNPTGKSQDLPSGVDVVFIPYLERMNASLAYYKGLNLREEHPAINNWLNALEQLNVYRGTQGDIHTHAHDLPPQMGGCWIESNPSQQEMAEAVDSGEGLGKLETCWSPPADSSEPQPEALALARVIKHRHKLLKLNPLGVAEFDQPLRASLTRMLLGAPCSPDPNSASGLRYLRDRVSVPRDMPLIAARRLRQALEHTAQIDSSEPGPPLPIHDRFDQNPEPFLTM
ncbi:MAG TPA: glutathione S-transferase family protein [Prochlorococcus sp.]